MGRLAAIRKALESSRSGTPFERLTRASRHADDRLARRTEQGLGQYSTPVIQAEALKDKLDQAINIESRNIDAMYRYMDEHLGDPDLTTYYLNNRWNYNGIPKNYPFFYKKMVEDMNDPKYLEYWGNPERVGK